VYTVGCTAIVFRRWSNLKTLTQSYDVAYEKLTKAKAVDLLAVILARLL